MNQEQRLGHPLAHCMAPLEAQSKPNRSKSLFWWSLVSVNESFKPCNSYFFFIIIYFVYVRVFSHLAPGKWND